MRLSFYPVICPDFRYFSFRCLSRGPADAYVQELYPFVQPSALPSFGQRLRSSADTAAAEPIFS